MTQAEVAAAAGIDRSRYVNLEGGTATLTEHYATKLEPVLGSEVWDTLTLPQLPQSPNGRAQRQPTYLDRLRALEARDARREEDFRRFAESTTGRLVALEAARVTRAPRGSQKAPGGKGQR